MIAKNLRVFAPIALAVATLLSACGGGGGSAPSEALCLALPEGASVRTEGDGSAWNDVLVDRAGRLWLAGHDGASAGVGGEPQGNTRAVLWRLDRTGALRWSSGDLFQTTGSDAFEALAEDGGGVVHAVGRTTGAFAGRANAGKADVFVTWSDAAASSGPWSLAQFGNERPQHPRRAAFQPGGALVVAGYDDEYIPTNHVVAWTDPFATAVVPRTSAGGAGEVALVWHHQFATAEPDLIDGLAIATDGVSTFVTGQFGGGEKGMFVRRLDARGQAVWTARYSRLALDHIAAIVALPDGTLWLGGSVYGSFHGARALGQQDVFVARIDPMDGHVLAAWQFGTGEADWLADLRVDANGNLVLLGETTGAFDGAINPDGGTDLFALRVSKDGRLIGARQWGAAGDESAARLAVDACGNAVAVGSTMRDGFRRALLWFWPAATR